MEPDRDEPLLDGLTHLPAEAFEEPEEAPELFDRILARTTGVVRRRRRIRTAMALAAAVLIFVVGAATGRLTTRPEAAVPDRPEVRVADVPEAPREVREGLPADSQALETRLADTKPEDRARVLREAGDEYLSGADANPEAALYCYRRLLEDPVTAGPDEDDSWLLIYMKLARSTE